MTAYLCPMCNQFGNMARSLGKFQTWHQASSMGVSTRGLASKQLPSEAQVVVCGAGIVGNSVAYHLVQNGLTDVLVIDKDTIGSGTSHFSSGTLGLFKPTHTREIIMNSIKLYRQLQAQGFDIGLRECGSLNLAQTHERMIALRRRMAYNAPSGLHCEVVSRAELQKLHPLLFSDDLEGGIWVEEDAVAQPQSICHALATLAQTGGAKYVEHCEMEQILIKDRKVYGMKTNLGTVKCEYFVNSAGMWARDLGLKSNPRVAIPAYPAEHFYAITEPFDVNSNLPCVRDFDSSIYAREFNGGVLVGGFELEAKPAFTDGLGIPKNWKERDTSDWTHFRPLWEKAVHRMPVLGKVPTPHLLSSPDNFTPDGRWVIGEAPEVRNYLVAVGMNGNPLEGGGGIGRAVAEWIIEGEPTQDLLSFSVQRFLDLHNNRQYLQERTKEVVGRHYAIMHPMQCEYNHARKLRCSPLYSVLERYGAVFGTRMAFERPLYFDSSQQHWDKPAQMPPGTFYKPKFFKYMQEEFQACQEGVGIIDMSSFSKILIKSNGPSVLEYLQRLCSNDVNIPVGGIVHTGMQNERGGYENDCILVRQDKYCFFMVSPTSQQTRVFEWMRSHLDSDGSVTLKDLTSMYTVINVVGHKSRQLLSELSNAALNLHSFTYRKVNVGYASNVLVMAFTHTGEPGYCLYIPSEYALHVYDRLMKVGRDYGARNVGMLTQRFMRIEKFIPFWAEDLNSETTPFETGSGYLVKLDKEYFIGKYALTRQKKVGVTKRLVMFSLDEVDPDKDVWAWGGEPIYRNKEFVGTLTSAGYGFTGNKIIGLGFVTKPGLLAQNKKADARTEDEFIITPEWITEPGARYEIDIAGHLTVATPHIYVPTFTAMAIEEKQGKSYRPTVVKSS
ncbi:pyruvate dehydrogenase phosphatase regulatory subunit, mitochondrial-like [Thrips palmi]|uniref:Pyruvate dehydrogenase phosphatase regulatory subunit, mitochondrial-like n=1 Tax=Thrips palmi TaxID=161013 RepID=A0A6P8YT39_THRPL|nr:pyruvate dehydrogenase phosphatase regulatory subunit, mitochondrial-like [Thrips palmi]XP_034237227.1 pyruvate dehydrogenase phosphatase regulatory subunit, mitochondrial-like [Thrips palmi]